MAYRVLFVDDEPAIRETLPHILALHGFEVVVKATVAEALAEIAYQPFDVLISDLNIGEPGDGFTVVSAMRRTQPRCLTFILTGFPGFETALQAIRSQVDGYLTKPTRTAELIATIQQRLDAPGTRHQPVASKRISGVIRENIEQVVQRTLVAMQADPELAALPLSDEQRAYCLAPLLNEMASALSTSAAGRLSRKSMQSAAVRGRIGRLQGYSIPLMVASLRLLENALYDAIGENLLVLDVSFVISDMRQLSNALALQLEAALRAYLEIQERRLLFDSSPEWTGWHCARCCWHRPAPASEGERLRLAESVAAEFEAHDCETFARDQWLRAAG